MNDDVTLTFEKWAETLEPTHVAGEEPARDWTEELIGRLGRPGVMGLLERTRALVWLPHPDDLQRLTEAAAGIFNEDAPDTWRTSESQARALLTLVRALVDEVEKAGLRWSWEQRCVYYPKGGRPLARAPIVAAYIQLGGSRSGQYDTDMVEAIQARLDGLVPSSRLTRDAITSALRRTYNPKNRAG